MSLSIRCLAPGLAVCFVLLIAGSLPQGLAQDGGGDDSSPVEEKAEPPLPEPQPDFGSDANRTVFDEAVVLFEDEKWKPAEKLFKACQKGESKDVKKDVKLWLGACKAGPMLSPVDKAINKSKWKLAWSKLQKVRHKYGETPIKEKLGILQETIEREIFLILATFEEEAPEPEKNIARRPQNSKINTDPKYVSQGERSLRWAPGKVGIGTGGRLFASCPIAKLDGEKIAEYPYLHLSIYATEKDSGRYTFFLDTGDQGFTILQTRCFFKHHPMVKPGWQHLRIDLRKEFSNYNNPTLEEVQEIAVIVIPPTNTKPIYIDDVKLEKK